MSDAIHDHTSEQSHTADQTIIDIPFPNASVLHLKFAVGACRLTLRPSDKNAWVSGTYTAPSGTLPLKIEKSGGTVLIGQDVRVGDLFGQPPTFDLELGKARAYLLTFETGASDCELEVGGLPLVQLTVRQGAGRFNLAFSSPNPAAMGMVDVDSGAGEVTLRGLANANAEKITLDGGAAAFSLDFGGTLTRDTSVHITAAMASVGIHVPASIPVKAEVEVTLGSMEMGDGFMKNSGLYVNEAASAGKTPAVTLQASVTMGSFALRSH